MVRTNLDCRDNDGNGPLFDFRCGTDNTGVLGAWCLASAILYYFLSSTRPELCCIPVALWRLLFIIIVLERDTFTIWLRYEAQVWFATFIVRNADMCRYLTDGEFALCQAGLCAATGGPILSRNDASGQSTTQQSCNQQRVAMGPLVVVLALFFFSLPIIVTWDVRPSWWSASYSLKI